MRKLKNDTTIIYDGHVWYLTEGYYRNEILGRLHRYIWEKHKGKIPEGCVIHHIDGDKTNNEIDNLKLMKWNEHAKNHATGEKFSDERKQKISQSKKGKKLKNDNPRWVDVTEDMITDCKNGMFLKDFKKKYNLSQVIWDRIRRGDY